jgi:ribosomal protein S1
MIEQEILIQLSDDPFDTKKVKVTIPSDVKILKGKTYTLESLEFLKEYISHENSANGTSFINNGDVMSAKVASIVKKNDKLTEALVDIDSKYTISCSLLSEPKEIVNQLVEGMSLDVKVKLKSGKLSASISDAINEVKIKELISSIDDKSTAYKCKVLELIHGGYWVNISGIKCFMPGSLAGLNKLYDFNMILGKELIVLPVTFSNEKNTVVVSHREYLKTQVPGAIEYIKESIKNKKSGFVTGTTDFGVFVEFNECLTGLIPNSELDDTTLSKFNSKDIKPGHNIEFWVKELISDKKIILSQKGPIIDLWDTASEKYKPMMITQGTVSKITSYGMFVELEKGISGLIHKSKIKDLTFNRGDKINVKITGVNVSERKITMNII